MRKNLAKAGVIVGYTLTLFGAIATIYGVYIIRMVKA